MKKYLSLLFLCFLFIVNTCWGNSYKETFRLGLSPAPIKIDGKIDNKEWQYGSVQFGSKKYYTNRLTDRQATFYLARDAKNIYFACQSELPPKGQKLLSRVRKDSLMVTMDDTVELYVYPPNGKYVYQIIANGKKAKYTAKYEMLSGAIIRKPKAYSPKVAIGSSISNTSWNIEIQLPFDQMEIPKDIQNKPWLIQMVRSWQNPTETSSFTCTRIYCDTDKMAKVFFDNNSCVAGFASLGKNYANGNYALTFPLFNPSNKKKTLLCSVNVKSTAAPRELTQSITLLPKESKNFTFNFFEKANFVFEMNAMIKENNKVLYARNFTWQKTDKNRWSNESSKPNNADLEIAVYPYLQKIKMRYGSSDVNSPATLLKAEFSIQDKKGKTHGKIHLGEKKKYGFSSSWDTGKLPANEYFAVAKLTWKNNKTTYVKKPFLIQNFEWMYNNIGKERIIIPPFKPLKVDKNQRKISSLLTTYQSNKLLWKSIFAENENILANAITLSINGNKDFFGEKSFSFTEISPDIVKSKTQLTNKSLDLDIENSYEYDNMCKTTFTFTPKKEFYAKDVTLTIPIKSNIAQLYHCVNDVPRYHPADKLPKKDGVLWNSTQGKTHPNIRGNFWPYVWIGDIYKGLCWFAPSDKNWSLDPAKPALEIIRKGNQVSLLVHLVNMPIKWNKPVTIVMGFQPTPVKKAPKNWRSLSFQRKPNKNITSLALLFYWAWGATTNWNSWPVNNDYSLVSAMSKNSKAHLTKKFLDDFYNKHKDKYPQEKLHILRFHLAANMSHKNNDILFHYLNPRSADSKWPSYQVFQNEWFSSEYRTQIDYDEYNIEATSSYQDMLLWYAKKLLKAGSDGIYYDNVRVRATYDPIRGPAYELNNGKIQPYFDFFSFRELLKRTATLLYLEKKTILDDRPFFTLHMTNGNIIPFLSFASNQLDLESEYGPKEFHDRFTEGYFLSETIATQGGNIPQILCSITGNNRENVSRTFLSMQLAMDIPMCTWIEKPQPIVRSTWQKLYDFGYGQKEVVVYPSWDKANPIKTNSKDVRITTYINPTTKETILAICDLGNSTKNVTVNLSKLGFKVSNCINLENNQKLPITNDQISVKLPRRNFKLIKLK